MIEHATMQCSLTMTSNESLNANSGFRITSFQRKGKIMLIPGVFRPYVSLRGDDRLPDILIPLGVLLVGAIVSAIPLFQIYGMFGAVPYTIVSFFILCSLRWWMLGLFSYETEEGPYISPSVIGFAGLFSIVIPATLWLLATYFVARFFLGWELPS